MEFDPTNWPIVFQSVVSNVHSWFRTIDSGHMLLASIVVLVVFFLRKKLSYWIVGGVQKLLNRFSVKLSDEVIAELKVCAQILAVTFSLYLVQDAIHPPELIAEILQRILISVALVAVFATWFQLSGPFVSLLIADRTEAAIQETGWIQRVCQFAILLFGLTAFLEVWQIDISNTLTGVGVLGAGLAISTQDLIRNLVAGMTNMSEKRFKSGDVIQVEGQFVGTVERIDLRSTLVVGFDQIPRHIPNSDLSNSIVLNYTTRKHRRVQVTVPLVLSSTQSQIETVRDELRKYHLECGDFQLTDDAAQYIYIKGISSSSVDILVYVWTTSPNYEQYLQAIESLTLAIMGAVDKADTELAYPTQTLHLDGDLPGT